jgi:hypothetical protein
MFTLPLRAGGQREGVAAASGLRQGKGAQQVGREAGEVSGMLLGIAPTKERIVHQCVLHVHVDGSRRVHPGQLLDGQHRHEDGPGAASVLLGHLDTHEAELEELGDEVRPKMGRLVHLLHVGTDIGLGKLADRVPEHGFFFGQDGQSRSGC